MRRINLIFSVLVVLILVFGSTFVGASSSDGISLEDLTKNIEFREKFGFKTDIDYVKKVIMNNLEKKEAKEFGVILSDEELNEIHRRIQIQEKNIPILKGIIKETGNSEFTWMYIDQKNNGKIVVGIKNIEDPKVKNVVDKIKEKYPFKDELVFKNAKYTEEELDSIAIEIIYQQDELKQKGIEVLSTSVDIINEQVIVGVSIDSEEVKTKLYKIFKGNPIRVIKVDRPVDATIEAYGGERITNDRGGYCSVGYSAKDSNDNHYIITAGHCSRTWNPNTSTATYHASESYWYQLKNETYLGSAHPTKWNYGSTVDGMAISVANSSYTNDIININGSLRSMQGYQLSSEDVVGQIACKTGTTTGATCGTLKSRNVSYTIDGAFFYYLRGTDITSDRGDSGGTVYSGFIYLGITKGSGGGYSHVYSHIDQVNQALNVTPIY